jgi:MATE family multidrug resistance protein
MPGPAHQPGPAPASQPASKQVKGVATSSAAAAAAAAASDGARQLAAPSSTRRFVADGATVNCSQQASRHGGRDSVMPKQQKQPQPRQYVPLAQNEEEREEQAEGEQDSLGGGAALKSGFCTEARELLALAGPLAAGFSFQMASQQLNAVFVGHLGATELGAATLGVMWTNITGFSVLWGGMTALDTLGSQAYGAENYRLVGVLAQRALFICAVVSLPVMLVWWHLTAPVLHAIGVEEPVVELAASFTRWYCLSLWPQIGCWTCLKFLSMQGMVKVNTVVQAATLPVNALLTWGLVYHTRLGFVGSPIAQAVAAWWQLAVFLLLLRWRKLHIKCWHGWSSHAVSDVHGLLVMLKLGTSGTLQVMGGWWSWELNNAMAGSLGRVPLAAHACMVNMAFLTFPVLDGIGTAESIRVGQRLGAGDGAGGWLAVKAAMAVVAIFLAIMVSALWNARGMLAYLYTADDEVAEMASATVSTYAIWAISDTSAFMGGCALRGAGKQSIGAAISLVQAYCFGVPTAYFLGVYLGVGIQGLWLGMALGQGIACTCQFTYMGCKMQWEREAFAARQRALEKENDER